MLCHFFECGHGLARAIAGRRRSDNLRSTINIETVGVLRARDSSRRHQRRKRNHVAIVIPHVILFDVAVTESLFTLRLEEYSPLSAETVELV